MWRYREHVTTNSVEYCGKIIPRHAYIWKSEEDQSQDSICMYRSNLTDSHMDVVYFTYDFDSVDLAKESFINSVKNVYIKQYSHSTGGTKICLDCFSISRINLSLR